MIEVLKINKQGNRVLSYTCTDGSKTLDLTKEHLIDYINKKMVSNAKLQIYKGTSIIRVKEAPINQHVTTKEVKTAEKTATTASKTKAQTPKKQEVAQTKQTKQTKKCIIIWGFQGGDKESPMYTGAYICDNTLEEVINKMKSKDSNLRYSKGNSYPIIAKTTSFNDRELKVWFKGYYLTVSEILYNELETFINYEFIKGYIGGDEQVSRGIVRIQPGRTVESRINELDNFFSPKDLKEEFMQAVKNKEHPRFYAYSSKIQNYDNEIGIRVQSSHSRNDRIVLRNYEKIKQLSIEDIINRYIMHVGRANNDSMREMYR